MKKVHWSLILVLAGTIVWAKIRSTPAAPDQENPSGLKPFSNTMVADPVARVEEPDGLRYKVILLD